jgi:hypothetical protein
MRHISWLATKLLACEDSTPCSQPVLQLPNANFLTYISIRKSQNWWTFLNRTKESWELGEKYKYWNKIEQTGVTSKSRFWISYLSLHTFIRLATSWKFRGSNPCGGRNFLHPCRLALELTQPPVQWITGFRFGEKSCRRVALKTHPI